MELQMDEKAGVTWDVDVILRGDLDSLLGHLDTAFAKNYEEFAFERDEPQPLELRPTSIESVARPRRLTGSWVRPLSEVWVSLA
jgi:hypothetical protein